MEGRGRGELINFPPLKRGGRGLLEMGGLFERGGGLIEDLRYPIYLPLWKVALKRASFFQHHWRSVL